MGLGVVPRSKRLEVRIPAGVEEGSRVRFAGEGGSGLAGGPRGDLYLKVHILPHPVFERQGSDLHTNVPIPLYTALLGGEAIVPSLRGDKLGLAIPADTPNSKIFRLSGQGMPVLNQPGVRGNLFVKVEIVLPNNLSDEEKRLFRHLRELRPQ
jgi:DnaJ-class molecular chaperone